MAKELKLYIPLISKNGSMTLINARKIKKINEIIPPTVNIVANLVHQKKRIATGKEYSALQVKVTKEKFEELEKQLKLKKPGHIFKHKAFDLIIDSKTQASVVQIISV